MKSPLSENSWNLEPTEKSIASGFLLAPETPLRYNPCTLKGKPMVGRPGKRGTSIARRARVRAKRSRRCNSRKRRRIPRSERLRVCVLGSSSRGNCTFVAGGESRILVDTGNLPIKSVIGKGLSAIGSGFPSIQAILITHIHSDHLNSNSFSISYRYQIPIYLNRKLYTGNWNRLRQSFPFFDRCVEAELIRLFDLTEFSLGNMVISPLPVPHDGGVTVAFTFQNDGKKAFFATDLGCVTEPILREMADSDIVLLESNHDVEMEIHSGRDPQVIKRNLSDWGHLSNTQAAKAIEQLLEMSRKIPSSIILTHISEEANRPDLALKTVRRPLKEFGRPVPVYLSFPRKRSKIVEV